MSEYCKGGSADDTSALPMVAGGNRVGIADSAHHYPPKIRGSQELTWEFWGVGYHFSSSTIF